MKFKLFQKYNQKILIWSGAVSLFISLVGLLIIWAIPFSTNQDKVMIAVQILVNELLIWLLLWTSNLSRAWLQFLVQIEVYWKKKELDHINLTINKSIYFLLIAFLGILWLIETSSFTLWTKSWMDAINQYWWITLIFFGINYFYLLIFWACQIYLYNRDAKILKNLRDANNRIRP